MRTPNEEYPQYHTSADNLSFVHPRSLADSWAKCLAILEVLEHNQTYQNLKPKCEPRLGKSGLYHAFGSVPFQQELQQAILWTLNFSDGDHSLLDIANRSQMKFSLIAQAAQSLGEHGFIRAVNRQQSSTSKDDECIAVPTLH